MPSQKHRSRRHFAAGSAIVVSALQAWVAPASAEGLRVEPSITSSLLWSDNTTLGQSDEAKSDLIVNLRPSLRLTAGGPSLRLNGSVGVDSVSYVNGTQSNDTAPNADLSLSAVLAQRLLFVDASVRSFQSASDLFGVSAESSTSNRYTTMQYALSPYLDRELSQGVHLNVRSDNTWTASHGEGAPNDDGYFGRHAAAFTILPRPIGLGIEAGRTETKYRDATQSLDRDEVRGSLSAAYDERFSVALVAGRERYRIAVGLPEDSHSIYGARMEWNPSARTKLEASVERRFFGTGWEAIFTHRSPFLAWKLSTLRQVSSYAERLFSSPAGSNVAELLDAAFMTRFPDATERARAVQDFLAQRGLPANVSTAVSVFSDRVDLYNALIASVAYIGPRDSTTLTVYNNRVETLPGIDPIFSLLYPNNYRDRGGSITWSHRLTQQAALVATYRHSDTEGFDANAGERTKQDLAQLEWTQALSPQTSGQIGVRYQMIDSTVNHDGHESAAFVGLRHRF